jgi:hypothetical protein
MMKKFILIFLPFLLSLGCINDNHNTNLKEKEQSLEEYECYFFFITDCPASRNNLLKMNEIDKKYSRLGLNIIGVVSDPYMDTAYLANTLNELNSNLNFVIDSTLSIAKAHNATVTPEIFLYKNSVLIYSGLLDNYYISLGKHRQRATINYLENAINCNLQQKPYIKRTEPIGCWINFNTKE